jgi:putative Mn2+ efflux pump MntP
MVRIDIVTPAIMIGIITAAVTATAMLIGSRIGKTLGSRFEVVGGLVLIGIGIKVLVSHLI